MFRVCEKRLLVGLLDDAGRTALAAFAASEAAEPYEREGDAEDGEDVEEVAPWKERH